MLDTSSNVPEGNICCFASSRFEFNVQSYEPDQFVCLQTTIIGIYNNPPTDKLYT